MGKVQDTINRIARRHRHNATQSIALVIPSQQKPAEHSFPTSYNGVAKWLAAQTSATCPTQVTGLIHALQHSNRLANTATERLQIITLFKTRVDAVLPPLKKQFVGSGLPCSDKAIESYDHTTTLLQELAYGYKIALVDVLLRRSGLHRLDRIHAIYSAMRYLCELGLSHSQCYHRWPQKCWRDINTLYWLADKESATDETVRGVAGADNLFPPTIAGVYTTASLFQLSDSDHLSAPHMEQLIGEFSKHAAGVQLLTAIPQQSSPTLHSVALNSAVPPSRHRFRNYDSPDQIRCFDTLPIARALLNHQPTTTDRDSLTGTQVHKIVQRLHGQSQRHSARSITSVAVSIQTGLKNCHTRLQQKGREQTARTGHWRLVNVSRDGCCLHGVASENQPLRIGHLITCQLGEAGESTLRTGLIRWLHALPQNQIRMGIEYLGQSARSLYCGKSPSKELSGQPRQEALIFTANNLATDRKNSQATTIVLPENCYHPGDQVSVYPALKSAEATRGSLAESPVYSAGVDCFRLITTAPGQPNAMTTVT